VQLALTRRGRTLCEVWHGWHPIFLRDASGGCPLPSHGRDGRTCPPLGVKPEHATAVVGECGGRSYTWRCTPCSIAFVAAFDAGEQLAHGRVVGFRGRAGLALWAELGGRAYTRCHWRCGSYSYGCPIWLSALRWLVCTPIFLRECTLLFVAGSRRMSCVRCVVIHVASARAHMMALQP